MTKYPEQVTKDDLEELSHVSGDEIKKDIADTEIEITNLQKEVAAFDLLIEARSSTTSVRMEKLWRDAKKDGINQRYKFIDFLRLILAERESQENSSSDK